MAEYIAFLTNLLNSNLDAAFVVPILSNRGAQDCQQLSFSLNRLSLIVAIQPYLT
jgi:hypothetical protein